ncbi:hypothetical protein ACTMSW_26275 [Micromonospora sp. BQ11]|uniref:hypothetical protein n=1 Tax=Micromonospora sp. BQ11 TaxID=3452212 RepID=UPI003F8BAA16
MTASIGTSPSRTRRWARRLPSAVLALLLLVALAVAPAATGPTDRLPAGVPIASTYGPFDVGFAEGSGLLDTQLARRLDDMVVYVPGRSPMIRIDLDWWYVQDCRTCALRWDRLDPVVDAARARGIRVLLVLAYAPPWANGGNSTDKWFPTNDADWTAIVDATVQHFAGRVHAYEVWNEPNIGRSGGREGFGNYATDRKARYWQLVRLAYPRIHAACADCVVLAGASGNGAPVTSTGNPNESALWLDWAYRNGYGRYFDAVAHHPYPAWNSGLGPARPECVNRWWNLFGPPGEKPPCGELAYLRSVMVKHGDGAKKIWGTEFGYPTSGATGLSRETLRDHLVQGVHMWRALSYTGPLFLFSYRDACVDAADPECNFGVVTRDFTPKEPIFSDLSVRLSDSLPADLRTGQTLRRWAGLRSLDDRFELWLQDDGNLVLYRRGTATAIWATNTRDGVRLVNGSDGNLALHRADGTVTWSTRTGGHGPATLWLQEDGNLVLYRNSDAKPVWVSDTVTG